MATTGFAADGLGSTDTDDNIDIAAGFSRDASGNAATTDGELAWFLLIAIPQSRP